MKYLKSFVSGEAAKLIETFKATDTHTEYDEAWDTFKNRFDNKSFIIDTDLKSVCCHPTIAQTSSLWDGFFRLELSNNHLTQI